MRAPQRSCCLLTPQTDHSGLSRRASAATANTLGPPRFLSPQVWDVKGALTWRSFDDERVREDPSTSAGNNDDTDDRIVGDINSMVTGNGDDDNRDCSTNAINKGNSNSNSNTGTTKEMDHSDPPSGYPTPSVQTLLDSSSSPFSDARHDDATSLFSLEEEAGEESSAGADKEVLGGSEGTPMVQEDSDEGRGSSNIVDSSAVKRGDYMMWPSEPSESIKGEDYGDR